MWGRFGLTRPRSVSPLMPVSKLRIDIGRSCRKARCVRPVGLCALIAVLCAASSATSWAQATPSIHSRNQPSSAIDQWLTSPTAIRLTPAEQKLVDTMRTSYEIESRRVRHASLQQDDITTTLQMRDLVLKYQAMVRALLDQNQRTIFDRNVRSTSRPAWRPPE